MINLSSKKFIIPLASVLFLLTVLFICQRIDLKKENKIIPEENLNSSVQMQNKSTSDTLECESSFLINKNERGSIGVWVPYLELAIQDAEKCEEKFKLKFDEIIKTAKMRNISNIIFHVRPLSDALYPSKIFPWSHLLTGTQGVDPGFDPLKYAVEQTHKNDMKIEAWINPLRIKTDSLPPKFSSNHPYFKFKEKKYFINHDNGWVSYNPAYPEIRELVTNGIKEIVENYNVDAIHFDDYFYPETSCADEIDAAYMQYVSSIKNKNDELSLIDWKKENINLLIKESYKVIKDINPKILFGVSPCGNLAKLDAMGADVKTWVNNSGFVDYLAPQLYWSLKNPAMRFEDAAKQWHNITKGSKVKLYAGLALYKAGSELDSGTWQNDRNILAQEFELIKNLNYSGIILYSSGNLSTSQTQEELTNLLAAVKKS